jgi:hypothetical protein
VVADAGAFAGFARDARLAVRAEKIDRGQARAV